MSNILFISDAAREVKVECHVLRYWEEELHLPIKRNELGHRYYTEDDVERFKQIKSMKERGLQLKAIKMILKDGRLDVLSDSEEFHTEASMERSQTVQEKKKGMEPDDGNIGKENCIGEEGCGMAIDIIKTRDVAITDESRETKARRLQWLLQQMIRETLQENNDELCKEIRESVVKELDYQFRMQEEREEARDRQIAERDEAYYKRMDDLLRKKTKKGWGIGKTKGTS